MVRSTFSKSFLRSASRCITRWSAARIRLTHVMTATCSAAVASRPQECQDSRPAPIRTDHPTALRLCPFIRPASSRRRFTLKDPQQFFCAIHASPPSPCNLSDDAKLDKPADDPLCRGIRNLKALRQARYNDIRIQEKLINDGKGCGAGPPTLKSVPVAFMERNDSLSVGNSVHGLGCDSAQEESDPADPVARPADLEKSFVVFIAMPLKEGT